MTSKTMALIGLATGLWLVFTGEAQAFYNPSTGRWLSRDPLGELSFLFVVAHEQPFVAALSDDAGERVNRLFRETVGPNVNAFVGNSPTFVIDRLGLYAIDNGAGFPEGTVARVKQSIDSACGTRFRSLVTADPKSSLYCCLRKMCDKKGKVVLSTSRERRNIDGEWRKLLGQANCYFGLFGSSIDLLILNGNKTTDWGAITIHEFAHCCGWGHGMPGLASWISDSTL
jgi:hypothetical protein